MFFSREQPGVNPANQMNQDNQAAVAGLNTEVLRACLSQLELWKQILSNFHAQTQKQQRKLDVFPGTLTETTAEFCRTGRTRVSECDFER